MNRTHGPVQPVNSKAGCGEPCRWGERRCCLVSAPFPVMLCHLLPQKQGCSQQLTFLASLGAYCRQHQPRSVQPLSPGGEVDSDPRLFPPEASGSERPKFSLEVTAQSTELGWEATKSGKAYWEPRASRSGGGHHPHFYHLWISSKGIISADYLFEGKLTQGKKNKLLCWREGKIGIFGLCFSLAASYYSAIPAPGWLKTRQ